MRRREVAIQISEHEYDTSIEYSVDPTSAQGRFDKSSRGGAIVDSKTNDPTESIRGSHNSAMNNSRHAMKESIGYYSPLYCTKVVNEVRNE